MMQRCVFCFMQAQKHVFHDSSSAIKFTFFAMQMQRQVPYVMLAALVVSLCVQALKTLMIAILYPITTSPRGNTVNVLVVVIITISIMMGLYQDMIIMIITILRVRARVGVLFDY